MYYFFESKKHLRNAISRAKIDELRQILDSGPHTGEIEHILSGEIDISADIRTLTKELQIYYTQVRAVSTGELRQLRQHIIPVSTYDLTIYPFSDTYISRYLDDQPLGKNPLVDIAGFSYGLFVQAIPMLGYLGIRLVFDALLLPYHIYRDSVDRIIE
jgi:hypothetical protein